MSLSKATFSKNTQNPQKNLQNLKNIAFIEFLEFFWTKYTLFYQNWPNIIQDISQNAKIAFNFLPDLSFHFWIVTIFLPIINFRSVTFNAQP